MSEHTTIEQASADLGPGPYWLACEHPERPGDRWTIWDWGCWPCYLHLVTDARTANDKPRPNTVNEDGKITHATLDDTAAAATEWRRERNLEVAR